MPASSTRCKRPARCLWLCASQAASVVGAGQPRHPAPQQATQRGVPLRRPLPRGGQPLPPRARPPPGAAEGRRRASNWDQLSVREAQAGAATLPLRCVRTRAGAQDAPQACAAGARGYLPGHRGGVFLAPPGPVWARGAPARGCRAWRVWGQARWLTVRSVELRIVGAPSGAHLMDGACCARAGAL